MVQVTTHNLPPHVEQFIRNSELSTEYLRSIERMIAARNRPRLGVLGWFGVVIVLLFAMACCVPHAAHAEPQTQSNSYDRNGHYTGTATTNGNSTTFTNGRGQFDGTSITRGNTTTYYDRNGHYTGSVVNPPRR